MPSFRAALLALLLTLAAAGPAAAQAPSVPPLTVPGGATDLVPQVPDAVGTVPAGPDAVMSDNVKYLGSIKQDEGLTTGAKVIGNRMFVTSGKNISIYDISDPAKPKNLGGMKANVAWENEEVPTNGKVLAVASDFYSIGVPECVAALAADGCVQLFDVRDPAHIKQVGTIPVANHTAECVLDCQYFYGRAGTIIDARGVLDGKAPTVVGNWIDELKAQGVEEKSCHHIREIRPGVLLTACQPFAAISVNAADGGSPAHPKVLYTGEAAKFVHSARWPRSGRDKFVLIGGEQNFTGRCERNNSEFSVYGAGNVLKGRSTRFEGPISQVPPAGNGVYADGKPVAGALGCSVHWFQEHKSFKNGGLVAISEYEDGVRFLQVTKTGQITEQGYFLSLGSSSSSPKWAGKDDVLYSIDYQRGVDILQWKGKHYVPGKKERRGKKRGTNGVTTPQAPTKAQAAQRAALARELHAQGWSPLICSLVARGGARLSISPLAVRLWATIPSRRTDVKYMLLIHQGTTPLPGTDEWNALSPEEQGAVYASYQEINQTPGVTPGERMEGPETATTVRVQDGRTLTTDGPFAEIKEAIGGYMFLEADDLDAAIELAAKVPAARMGGGVEVRPIVG